MTINPIDGKIIPYAVVLYQTDSPITDDMRVLCHGNSKGNQSLPVFNLLRKFCLKQKNYQSKEVLARKRMIK